MISRTDLILNPDGTVYHLNLLPSHVSDKIIAVGDPNRVRQVSQFFDEIESEVNCREFITHVGRYKGKRITVISTGIGTDNVEIVLTELDALVNLDFATRMPKHEIKKLKVIRIGTSGALQTDIPVGSYVVSEHAIGFDNLHHFYNINIPKQNIELISDLRSRLGLPFEPYLVSGSQELLRQVAFDMISGNTVTCPGFYAPQGRRVRVPVMLPNLLADLNRYYNRNYRFRLTNFEMETSGYYALGSLMGHEILSVSAIIVNRIANTTLTHPNRVIETLIQKILDRI